MKKFKNLIVLLLSVILVFELPSYQVTAASSATTSWKDANTIALTKEGVIPSNIENMTFGQLLTYKATNYPNEVIASQYGYELTWKVMDLAVKNEIKALQALGVKQGDVVGLYGENSMNWMISFYALQAMGTVTHLLNFGIPEDAMTALINNYNVSYLVMGEVDEWETNPNYDKTLVANSNLKGVYDIRDCGKILGNLQNVTDVSYVDNDANAESIILYSSSFTGTKLKGAIHTPSDFMKIGIVEAQAIELQDDDRLLAVASVFHMLGFSYAIVADSIYNVETYFVDEDCREISVATLDEEVKENQITLIPAIGNTMNRLIYDEAFTKEVAADMASVRSIEVAGSAIYPEQIEYLYECFPNVTLTSLYGQTECAPISYTTYNDDFEHVSTSIGKVSPLVEIAFTDEGELIAKSEYQLKGFFMKPDVSATDDEGWVHTEDKVISDADGYLYSQGRFKEIVTLEDGDFLVPQITKMLVSSPYIADAYTTSIEKDGKTVLAVMVIMENNAPFNAQAIKDYLAPAFSQYQIPQVIVEVDEFPQMPNGKPYVKEIQAILEEAE